MAKAGRLGIETPFGKIRGRSGAGGIGMLSLVSLFFAALENTEADKSNVSYLDDGQINIGRPRNSETRRSARSS